MCPVDAFKAGKNMLGIDPDGMHRLRRVHSRMPGQRHLPQEDVPAQQAFFSQWRDDDAGADDDGDEGDEGDEGEPDEPAPAPQAGTR